MKEKINIEELNIKLFNFFKQGKDNQHIVYYSPFDIKIFSEGKFIFEHSHGNRLYELVLINGVDDIFFYEMQLVDLTKLPNNKYISLKYWKGEEDEPIIII